VCRRDSAAGDPVRDALLTLAPPDHSQELQIQGGIPIKTRGGGAGQRTESGGDCGRAPARFTLVLPQGVNRDQGAERV